MPVAQSIKVQELHQKPYFEQLASHVGKNVYPIFIAG